MTRKSLLLLLLLAAIWGAVYPLTTIALRGFPPESVVLGRASCAALVLTPIAARLGAFTAIRRQPRKVITASLLQAAIPLTLLTIGQQHVSAGIAGILSAAQPLFVATLVMGLDRTTHPRETFGVLTGLLGVGLLFAKDLDTGDTTALGGAAVLASALFFAAGAIYIHRALPTAPATGTAAAAMILTTLLTAPIALTGAAPTQPSPTEWASLIALGVLGNGAALGLFYALIRNSGPTRASLAWYLAPAFAVLYDIPITGAPTAAAIAGLLLIVTGSAITAKPNDHTPQPQANNKQNPGPPRQTQGP